MPSPTNASTAQPAIQGRLRFIAVSIIDAAAAGMTQRIAVQTRIGRAWEGARIPSSPRTNVSKTLSARCRSRGQRAESRSMSRAQRAGAATSATRTAIPARSIARTASAAACRNAGTGTTRTSTASIRTTARLSSTRSTMSVASTVQKAWPVPPAPTALQRRATTYTRTTSPARSGSTLFAMYPIMTAGTRPGGTERGGKGGGPPPARAPRPSRARPGGGRGRRLHEDALLAGEHPVGAQDLLVTDDVDPAVRVLHGLERRPPVRRVADLDRRRHGARLLDDAILVDRRRAGRLEADHARQLLHAPRAVVFAVPTPVRGDVPGVADGDQVVVGCAAELVHDLERGGLLPLEPERVHRVHECHRVPLGDPPDDRQRLVEVTVHGEDLRAVDRRLRELAEGDRALRHHHEGADPGARRERRRGGRGDRKSV